VDPRKRGRHVDSVRAGRQAQCLASSPVASTTMLEGSADTLWLVPTHETVGVGDDHSSSLALREMRRRALRTSSSGGFGDCTARNSLMHAPQRQRGRSDLALIHIPQSVRDGGTKWEMRCVVLSVWAARQLRLRLRPVDQHCRAGCVLARASSA